jgi:hypothetical protein
MSLDQPSYDSRSAYPPYGFSCLPYVDGPGVTRVRLSGELDIATAPQLDDALSEAARGRRGRDPRPERADAHGVERPARDHHRSPSPCQADCRLALVRAAGRYNWPSRSPAPSVGSSSSAHPTPKTSRRPGQPDRDPPGPRDLLEQTAQTRAVHGSRVPGGRDAPRRPLRSIETA